MRSFRKLVGPAFFFAATAPAAAQSAEPTLEDLKAKTDLVQAERDLLAMRRDLIKVEAELARERISALGLPTFEGKTTIESGGAKLEATMLAADALAAAAAAIAKRATGGPYLLLTGSEAVDFARYESLRLEMGLIHDALARALGGPTAPGFVTAAETIAAVSAIAGLLRSETTVSEVSLAESMSDRLLADAVATKLKGRAVRPAAMLRTPSAAPSGQAFHEQPLLEAWGTLMALAVRAKAQRHGMGDNPAGFDKTRAAELDLLLARFQTLADAATKAGGDGVLPLIAAARMERLADPRRKVLRVHVEHAGGSFITRKNLWTTLGFDPARVSGGLIVSYFISDPGTGSLEDGGVMTCRTAFTSLRKVQARSWAETPAIERCDQLL